MQEITPGIILSEEDIDFAINAVLKCNTSSDLYDLENTKEEDLAAEGRIGRIVDHLRHL